MQEHKSIWEAQLAVMREAPYVKKEKSAGLKYSFASETALIEKLRPVMLEHGIVGPIPVETTHLQSQDVKTSTGKEMACRLVSRVFKFVHVPTEQEAEVQVIGEAADSGDKAALKAQTIAKKYALREFFLIETGDDPDFLVFERGSPNYKKLARWTTMLASCGNVEKLKVLWMTIDKNAAEFNDDQLAELKEFYAQRYSELNKT